MIVIRFVLAIILLCGTSLRAEVSLPLDGYYRVGRYMPVVVSGANEISGRGVLTTRIDGGGAVPVVVPVLALDDDIDATIFPKPLRAVGENERLVGLVGVGAADVQWLFPEKTIVPIPLDVSRPLPGTPMAWETLDAIVCAGPIPGAGAGTYRSLLGSGVAFAVRSSGAPDATYPWQREGEWWLLRHEPAGPTSAIGSAAYAPVWSWTPGASTPARAMVVSVGVIVAIAALAATLLRSRRASVTAIAGVVIVAVVGVAAWARRQPSVHKVESGVFTICGSLMQYDLWEYQAADAATETSFNWFGNTRPMLTSADHAARQGVTLECGADGFPIRITARLGPKQKLACMSKLVEPLRPAVRSDARPGETDSPMQTLVRAAYLAPGMKTLGQYPSKDEQPWPSVILERDDVPAVRP